MNKVILQIWEEFDSDTITPHGATIHVSKEVRDNWTAEFYKQKGNSKLRACGMETEVRISEKLWNLVKLRLTVVLKESEFNNLITFEEIK
jgi:hypothetical protein